MTHNDDSIEAALADAHREEWARVLAATMRTARDLDLAEECVQEAYAAALVAWRRDGVPRNAAAWLTTIARRRAMDALRREQVFRSKLPLLVDPPASEAGEPEEEMDGMDSDIPDERLRLVFLCCHPALSQEAQVALTLRLVCGLSTADIGRAFLVAEATMAARITRAKKKISLAVIPFRLPRAAEVPARLRPVLAVIHLLFATGHTAPSGPSLLRRDLTDRALHLTRMLHALVPDEPEVRGLLALMLATDARRETRIGADGAPLPLAQQDRSRWDRSAIAEAHDLIAGSLRPEHCGRYVLQAAIAVEYAGAPSYERTDWRRILALYDDLLAVWPSPVVALNRTVALSMVAGPAAALREIEGLEHDGRLAAYQYLPAMKADVLRRLGRPRESAAAYRRALDLTANDAERAFLAARLAEQEARSV